MSYYNANDVVIKLLEYKSKVNEKNLSWKLLEISVKYIEVNIIMNRKDALFFW